MSQDVEDGRLVGGRYRLEGVLGRGGMGTVWRGRDETLGRTVAVKELRFPSSVDEDEKQRLITRTLREAKAIARIRSGSAITVFDVVDEDGRPWIVMELIEGKSLADRIREDGPLDPAHAAEVGLSVLDVLRAAHREGILHRDVKPSNVLLEEGTGRVVLTDFGIAKVEGDPSVTSTGMLVGAPSYISPERARGRPPGPPADLWSLGGLLYAAVEGRPPYDKGSAISTLTAVMIEPLPPPEQAGELSEAIYGLLEKDPDKRLDVEGARVLLEGVVSGAGAGTARTGEVAEPARAAGPPPAPAVPEVSAADEGDAAPAASAWSAGTTGGRAPAHGGGTVRSTERLRAALKSVRKAAAAAGTAAASTNAARPEPGTPQARTPGPGAGTASGDEGAQGDARTVPEPDGEEHRAAGEAAPAAARSAARTPGHDEPAVTGAGSPSPAPGGGRRFAPAALAGPITRRTLLAAVATVVAVLVVVGAVLASASGDDGRSDTSQGESGGKKEGEGAGNGDTKPGRDGAADDSGKDEGGRDGGGDDAREGDDGNGEGEAAGPRLPEGYKTVVDTRFRHSIALPADFERTGTSGRGSGRMYEAPQGHPKLQVDYNDTPLADAVLAWKGLERAVSGGRDGYHRLGIEKSGWRGYPTVADWTFERTEDGRRVRVLNRGFKVDAKRGYAIMLTCVADEWNGKECRTLRETAFTTFEPR